VLRGWQQQIDCVYAYYAAQGSSDDVFHIMLNAFSQMCEDFELVDKSSNKGSHCSKAAFDQLFITVDTTRPDHEPTSHGSGGDTVSGAGGGASEGAGGGSCAGGGCAGGGCAGGGASTSAGGLVLGEAKMKALDRSEFLQVLVRAAVMKYVLTAQVTDVSSAVDLLLSQVLHPKAELDSPTVFRNHIYVEEVDVVLRRHENALRILYVRTCQHLGAQGNDTRANSRASYAKWREFVRIFGLTQPDLTDRDVTLSFLWSRMVVVDEAKHRVRVASLSFEDFLEALCHIAAMKAWPTDDEVQEAGQPNAACFLLQLAAKPEEHARYLHMHKVPWGSRLLRRVPLCRCIDHLCCLLIILCQGGLSRPQESNDMSLNEKQAAKLLKTSNKK